LFWLFSQSYVDPVPLSKRSGIRQSSADKQRYQKCHIDPLVKNTAPSVTDALFCPLFPMGGCWHIPFQVPALLTQAADPTRGGLISMLAFLGAWASPGISLPVTSAAKHWSRLSVPVPLRGSIF
jgi:hypothetical protein